MITGRPPTTRRETYLRNLLSVVSKFPSFGIVEIGRPRYAKLRGDIISEMICKEIVYDVKTEVEFCTEELQVVGEDGEELLVSSSTQSRRNSPGKNVASFPMSIRLRTRKLGFPYTLNSKQRPQSKSSHRSRGPSQTSLSMTMISPFSTWTTTAS